MIAWSDSEPSSPSWSPSATPSCHLAPIRQRWPRSLGHQRRHGLHDTPHSLSARPLSSFLSLPRDSVGDSAISIAAASFASSLCPRLYVSPRLRASPSPPRPPPSFPPLGRTRSPRGEWHFTSSSSSGSRPSRPRFRRTSPLLCYRLLSSLWVTLRSA